MKWRYNDKNIKLLASIIHEETTKEQRELISLSRITKNYKMDEEIFRADLQWFVDKSQRFLAITNSL